MKTSAPFGLCKKYDAKFVMFDSHGVEGLLLNLSWSMPV